MGVNTNFNYGSPSARFLATALASDQHPLTIIQIWSGPFVGVPPALIQDISENCLENGTTWQEDETQSPRWTCSVTVESQGVGIDNLVPQVDGDLLHPLTGNELRIFSGYQWSDGTSEVVPCGVYRMSRPAITDDGSKVEIVITGNDRAFEISRRSWVVPYVISGAPTYDVAIQALINDRFPGLTYNFQPTTNTVPDITFGTTGMTSPVDPMGDAIQLATANGTEVFFDDAGVCILRVVPDPTTAPVTLNFTEGPNCTVNEGERVLDESQTYNGVVATSSAAGIAFPVQEVVWVTDPDSPLNPATFGYVPYFYTSPLITTSAQAIAAATSILQTLLTAYDNLSTSVVMNASLRAGDCNGVTRARLGVNDTYCASQVSNSTDPTALTTITYRARRTAA
jgi:hypothetical protein